MASEEEEKEVKEQPKSKKLLIVAAILVLLLSAGGAAAYFKFIKTPTEKTEETKEVPSAIYEMDTFMVNLADPGGKRFLKATMKLKVSSSEVSEECKLRNFELRDQVLIMLSNKETLELVSTDDKLALKRQLIEVLNRALRKGQILEIYFSDFLIQ
jgi:flagellar FliL protein